VPGPAAAPAPAPAPFWPARWAAALGIGPPVGSAGETGPTALGEMHLRRVRRMLLANCAVIAAGGTLWLVMFALHGQWAAVLPQALAIAAAAATVVLVRRGQLRRASRLIVPVMYVLLCFGAVFVDPPSAAVSRSIHQFLLAVGVMSTLLMRDEPLWLQRAVPLLFFLTYAAFAAFDLSIATPIALPVAERIHTAWVNHLLASVMVYVTLRLILTDVAQRSAEEGELRESLLRGDFVLHYQPQVDTGGRIVGAEALIRWNHPRRGMVPPGEFIAAAERCGLMLPMGDWVLASACATLVQWSRSPQTASLILAVNVSTVQFGQPDFVARVLSGIHRSGADPSRLKLEITESMLAKDLDDIVVKMTALKARGIGFSLDDFGTGFSSLSYLRRLPLDQLKIDQSFVRNLLSSKKDAAIAQAVVSLGQSLELEVIAEGVETPEQHRFLYGIGCSTYQGYLFSRPLPEAQFLALVAGDAQLPAVGPGVRPASATRTAQLGAAERRVIEGA
jgi:EAL domain-containing protein (putative c-di-GMP-specific phosphodiesterase class I)